MPFPDPILPIALIALIASGISMWVFNLFSSISSKIRNTHTQFAITQISNRLGELQLDDLPTTKSELVAVLRSSKIDWNSCEIEEGQILDGWGRPIAATFDEQKRTWTLHSSGKDGEIGTEDDIRAVAATNETGETTFGH